jgi:hypothetical protein
MSRKSNGPQRDAAVEVGEKIGASRIHDGDYFHGTAVVYAATPDDHTCFQCDFELDTQSESQPEHTRSGRRLRKASRNRPISDEQLKQELVVIFGPEMSASAAVSTLRRLAKENSARWTVDRPRSG